MINPLQVLTDAATRAGLLESADINTVCPITELGASLAAYFNMNIAECPSMWITTREGEALVQFVVAHT